MDVSYLLNVQLQVGTLKGDCTILTGTFWPEAGGLASVVLAIFSCRGSCDKGRDALGRYDRGENFTNCKQTDHRASSITAALGERVAGCTDTLTDTLCDKTSYRSFTDLLIVPMPP